MVVATVVVTGSVVGVTRIVPSPATLLIQPPPNRTRAIPCPLSRSSTGLKQSPTSSPPTSADSEANPDRTMALHTTR